MNQELYSDFSQKVQLKKMLHGTGVVLITYHGLAGAFLQIPQQDVVVCQRDDSLPVSRGLPRDTEGRSATY